MCGLASRKSFVQAAAASDFFDSATTARQDDDEGCRGWFAIAVAVSRRLRCGDIHPLRKRHDQLQGRPPEILMTLRRAQSRQQSGSRQTGAVPRPDPPRPVAAQLPSAARGPPSVMSQRGGQKRTEIEDSRSKGNRAETSGRPQAGPLLLQGETEYGLHAARLRGSRGCSPYVPGTGIYGIRLGPGASARSGNGPRQRRKRSGALPTDLRDRARGTLPEGSRADPRQ